MAEPKNPVGEEANCFSQIEAARFGGFSDPEQPGRLLLSCLTLPAAAAFRNGGILAGKELASPRLEKSTTKIVQNLQVVFWNPPLPG